MDEVDHEKWFEGVNFLKINLKIYDHGIVAVSRRRNWEQINLEIYDHSIVVVRLRRNWANK